MKSSPSLSSTTAQLNTDHLADFVMMTQRSCILNLSSDLNQRNISFPQFYLMTYLSKEDYLTMSAIAQKMGHSTAAATGLVDRLEKLGFVERVHAAEDRRKIMVRITPNGQEIVKEMRGRIASELSTIMSELDENDTASVNATNEAIRNKNFGS